MSTNTQIQWTDTTWNPVRGCSLVSAGCANCYAMKFAHRFSGKGKPYEGLTEIGPHGPRWTGNIKLVPEALEEPLRWKTPRRIFVNSMSDLFHEEVPFEFIAAVFGVMCVASQHSYQILTKRPERMRKWFEWLVCQGGLAYYCSDRCDALYPGALVADKTCACTMWRSLPLMAPFPLPNVWLGVSIEDQSTADERIPTLLQTPSAVRFVSAEPLLGSIKFRWDRWLPVSGYEQIEREQLRTIDWVILGGESGPGARPCDLAWIRSLKEQSQAASVPVFLKQLGTRVFEAGCEPAHVWTGNNPSSLHRLKDRKGGDMAEWPEDLRVREFPR